MKALVINTNNEITAVNAPESFSLRWVASKIDCDWIEIVRPEKLDRKYVMLIDEEGKLKPNKINPICSWLYGTEKHGDPIVGNAMIVKEDLVDGEPDLCTLTDDDVNDFLEWMMTKRLEVRK